MMSGGCTIPKELTGTNNLIFGGGSTIWLATSFTVEGTLTIDSVDAYITGNASADRDVTCYIYDDSSVSPNTLVSGCTTDTVVAANITNTTPAWINFNMSSSCSMTEATPTQYWFVCSTGTSTSNTYTWRYNLGGSLEVRATSSDGTAWTTSTTDAHMFQINGTCSP